MSVRDQMRKWMWMGMRKVDEERGKEGVKVNWEWEGKQLVLGIVVGIGYGNGNVIGNVIGIG